MVKGERNFNMKTTKIIAVVNQKGGVGKTTTAMNLGIELSKNGYKTLLVDFDPQGDLTCCLGWKDSDSLNLTTSTLLMNTMNNKETDFNELILHHNEGVDLIPSNIDLASTEVNLIQAFTRETILRNSLNQIKNDYDYVIIDCPPTLGLLTVNALSAATDVIIPVQTHYLSAKGMTRLIGSISQVRNHVNPDLNIAGICLTLYDARTNIAKSTVKAVKEGFEKHVRIFNTIIPMGIKASESGIDGKSVYEYAKSSDVAAAYSKLTKEVINIAQKSKTELMR